MPAWNFQKYDHDRVDRRYQTSDQEQADRGFQIFDQEQTDRIQANFVENRLRDWLSPT